MSQKNREAINNLTKTERNKHKTPKQIHFIRIYRFVKQITT